MFSSLYLFILKQTSCIPRYETHDRKTEKTRIYTAGVLSDCHMIRGFTHGHSLQEVKDHFCQSTCFKHWTDVCRLKAYLGVMQKILEKKILQNCSDVSVSYGVLFTWLIKNTRDKTPFDLKQRWGRCVIHEKYWQSCFISIWLRWPECLGSCTNRLGCSWLE